jgi:hypothetical protein
MLKGPCLRGILYGYGGVKQKPNTARGCALISIVDVLHRQPVLGGSDVSDDSSTAVDTDARRDCGNPQGDGIDMQLGWSICYMVAVKILGGRVPV